MSVAINGTNGLTFNDGSAQSTAATGFGFKNRIINGAMVIDQRNAGASVTPASNDYTVDRWQAALTQTSKFSVQRNAGSVTPPAGFTNYLGVTSLSAYSVVASDYFLVRQKIEGFNVADLGWGTANAQTVTLSFRVYSSLTGTFGGSLYNAAGTRSYPFSYSVPSANTWTTISITIAGDTTGTWATDNGAAIQVSFSLGAGSTYSGTAGSWSGAFYLSATGATSVVGTNAATWYITGVQLEKGSTATSFDYRPYGTELALCQRYYWNPTMTIGYTVSAAVATGSVVRMPVTMRATPTLGSSASFSVSGGSVGVPAIAAGTAQTASADGVFIINNSNTWTTSVSVQLNSGGFSAEL